MSDKLSSDIQDNEKRKFKQTLVGEKVAVRICADSTDPLPVSPSASTGTTTHFNGTQDTTPVNIPGTAGNKITTLLISNLSKKSGEDLFVSFDGGTTFATIFAGESLEWSPKGLSQVNFKSNLLAGVLYEIVMNRE